jgi:hypothetical protein
MNYSRFDVYEVQQPIELQVLKLPFLKLPSKIGVYLTYSKSAVSKFFLYLLISAEFKL